jgi:hypothetical protein
MGPSCVLFQRHDQIAGQPCHTGDATPYLLGADTARLLAFDESPYLVSPNGRSLFRTQSSETLCKLM